MAAWAFSGRRAIGLGAKGVGSVIERLKHGIREQILGNRSDSDDDQGIAKRKFPPKLVLLK